MFVAAALVNVGLVEVIGEDCVECRHVAGHAAHKAGQQRRESKSKNSRWEEMQQHVWRGHVVVKQRLAACSQHGLPGNWIDLGGNQSPALFYPSPKHSRDSE